MILGSNPKGTQSDNLLHAKVTRTKRLPADRRILTHSFVVYKKHGKPVLLLQFAGKWTVSETEWSAGRGIRKKRMPLCNGVDRG